MSVRILLIMQHTSVTVSMDLFDQLTTIKGNMELDSLNDVILFLVDVYSGIPSRVSKDAYLEMWDKYLSDYPQEFFLTSLEMNGTTDPAEFVAKFEKSINEKIAKRDKFIAEGTVFECSHCGNVWRYGGKNTIMQAPIFIYCPSCKYRISKRDARTLMPLITE